MGSKEDVEKGVQAWAQWVKERLKFVYFSLIFRTSG